jgi:hypothetical protein
MQAQRPSKVRESKVRPLPLGLCLLLAGGCELLPALGEKDEPKGDPDGAFCHENEDCESGFCTSEQLCAHSACECSGNTCGATGKEADPCAEDWVCTDADSIFDGVEEFFGGHARKDKGYCQPLCQPECPEHYYCAGTFCVPQVGWANPVPTIAWTGDAKGTYSGNGTHRVDLERGKSVTLEASASSPTDEPIRSYAWVRVTSRSQEPVMGQKLEITLGKDESFARADLTVVDERSRATLMSVIFNGCTGPGDACGYEGSGCCNGCDREANTCM